MTLRRAAIVAPIRTAVGKFGGSLASLNAGELGGIILKALMERTKIDPARVDDVVFSQGYGNAEAPAIGHWSWLAAGLPLEVPGYQLDRRCGSGLQAVVNAAMMVQTGASDVVVAGGVESMSNVEYYTVEARRGSRGGGALGRLVRNFEVGVGPGLGHDVQASGQVGSFGGESRGRRARGDQAADQCTQGH